MIWQKKRKVVFLAIGEAMIEISAKNFPNAKLAFGGDTLNTLIYFKRLTKNYNFLVRFVTRFGDDEISRRVFSKPKLEGVDISCSNYIPNRNSGLYVIELDENNDRKFHYWRSTSPARELLSLSHSSDQSSTAGQLSYSDQSLSIKEKEAILKANYIYFSGISIAILNNKSKHNLLDTIIQAKKKGSIIIFDLNLREKLWEEKRDYWYDKFLCLADVVFGSWDDILALNLDLSKYKIKEQILRKSDHSCQVEVKDNKKNTSLTINQKNKAIKDIVDTTAAGDAFSAGYLASRITGGNIENSLKLAFSIASVVVGHEGAIIDRRLSDQYSL